VQTVLEEHETAAKSPWAAIADGLGTIDHAGPAAKTGANPAVRLMSAAQVIPS
jgi:hypothetical protein